MLNILVDYWWAIALVIVVACFYALKFAARSVAKDQALKYLYACSKMAFANADEKVVFVTQIAYVALPKAVKTFVPYAFFSLLVASLYDELKDLVNQLHDNAEQAKPVEAKPEVKPVEAKPAVQPAEQAKPVEQAK